MKRRSLALLLSVVVMMTSIGDTALAAGVGEQPDVSAQEIFSDEMQDSFGDEEISSEEDTETGITDIPEKDTAKKEEDSQGQESEELTVEDEKNTEDGEPEDGEPEDAKPADVEPAVTDMDEPELSVSDSEEAASPAADTDTPAVFEAGTQKEAEYETIEDQTLQDDLVISGNAVFAGTAIDLNGHTLTVEGNLWHKSGNIAVNGGTLDIRGDYRNFSLQTEDGNCSPGYGTLVMEKESDNVIVGKDFYMYSYDWNHYNTFSAGTIRTGGNFKEGAGTFIGQGSHKVIFTGEGLHEIEMEKKEAHFNTLEVENGGRLRWSGYYNVGKLESDLNMEVPGGEAVKFYTTDGLDMDFGGNSVNVAGDAVHENGRIVLNGSEFTVTGNMKNTGDITLDQGTLCIGGNLEHENGSIDISQGTLDIKGDYRNFLKESEAGGYGRGYGSLIMENESDRMAVGKDFYMYSMRVKEDNRFTAGTIEIGGSFREGKRGENFAAEGSHKVIFTGSGLHEIEVGMKEFRFNVLEVENGGKLKWTGYYNVGKLESDLDIEVPQGETIKFYADQNSDMDFGGHCVNIAGDAEHENGKITLNGSAFTITGNLKNNGNIDLNQGTLSTGGNLLHTDGSINIGGGTLDIQGDYRNFKARSEDGSYVGGSGSLIMENGSDQMIVGKDFYMYSWRGKNENRFCAGTIRIGGDFKRGAAQDNFTGQGDHKVVFTGDGSHVTDMGNDSSNFNILEITGEYDHYVFNRIPCWNVLLKDNEKIENTVFGDYEAVVTEDEEYKKTAQIVGYTGSGTYVTVPDTIGGYTVTGIGDSAFENCVFLEELELPYTVTKLGRNIVNGCTGLQELIIHDSVTVIEAGNFKSGVPELLLYVDPESYAEEYARENGIPFEYYMKNPVSLEVSVRNPDGEILKFGYNICWYEADGFEFLGTGNRLKNLEEGKKYQFDLTLDEDLSYRYQQPKSQTVVASSGNTVTEVILLPHEQIRINGTVKDTDGQAIPSAKIRLKQICNGMYEKITATDAGEQGEFSVEAGNMAGTIVVTAEGYYDSVYKFSENPEDHSVTIDAVLKKLPANKINLALSMKKARKPGEKEIVTPLTDISGFSFKLYNETQKKEITDFKVQYPSLIIADNTIEKEDIIRLSVSDGKKQVADSENTVILDENKCASLDWVLTQNGSIRIEKISGNEENTVFVFDEKMQCIQNQTAGKFCQISTLPEGEYTLVVIKKTSLLSSVDRLDTLSGFGLEKDKDFAQVSVEVKNGFITELKEVKVSALDESKLYYTVRENTSFWASTNSPVTGQYVTMRAQYEISSKYTSSEECVQFDLPDDVTMVERSLTVDGKSRGCTVSGNHVTVNVGKKKGTIRFYVLAAKTGNRRIHAYLNFRNNAKKVIQPIGSVALDVSAAKISVPEKTGFREVTVTGKTLANSQITIYDNGTVAGKTVSNKNGSWGMEISLANPRSYSVHKIYAAIRNEEYDIDMQTDVSKLIYNKNYIEVSKVTMINTDWQNKERVTVFDFIHSKGEAGTYDYTPARPGFTFKVEFTGGDPDSIGSVYVVTKNSSGELTYVPCDYDSQSRYWIGTHEYLEFQDVPCSVDVRFDTEEPVSCDTEETSQEALESVVKFTELGKEIEEEIEKTVQFEDEAVEDEKVSFGLKCDGQELAVYQLEVLDYNQFDLKAWEKDNCQMYTYEDGTCRYQTSYTEDGTYITLMAFPDEKMLVKESLTLPEPEKVIGIITGIAGGKFYWGDFLKNTYDVGSDILETLSGLEDVLELWEEYGDIRAKEAILNAYLDTIEKELIACKCLDNSGYMDRLAGLQNMTGGFVRDSYMLFGGTILVNGLINVAAGRVGAMASRGAFKYSKKLYRYVQKKCGHSGRGQLSKYVRNSLEFLSDETGGWAQEEFEDIANFLENIFFAKENLEEEYEYLEATLRDMKTELKRRKCPCKETKGKCDCLEKNDPDIRDHPVTPKTDPSGYVYEAVPSNRIEGVKAEIYYYDHATDEFGVTEEEKSEIYWDAENYDQINPQYTDEAGTFGWNVPEGQWLVKFSKEGYESTDSHNDIATDEEGYLPVPPIQTEVNTAMVSLEAPAVSNVNVYQDGIYIDFSQYMQIDTVNTENITVTLGGKHVSGNIRPLNAEYDYEGKTQYASSFVLKCEGTLKGSAEVSIKNVKNYHGLVQKGEYNKTIPVQIKPESIKVEETEGIYYRENQEITVSILPAAAGINKTITVTSCSPSIVGVEKTTVTTDSKGMAKVKLKGNLPGQGVISVALDGTQLSAEQMVTVLDINTPKSLEKGNYRVSLEKESFVYNKKAQTPKVTVSGLKENTDFTVTYSNNINAGTAQVEVTGMGAYTGTLTKSFVITKASNKISASGITRSGSTRTQSVSLGAMATGGKLTYKSNNSKITVNGSGKVQIAANYVGKADIQIKASDRNYQTATRTVIVTVNPVANVITATNFRKICSKKTQVVSLNIRRKGSGKVTYRSNLKKVKISSSGKVIIPAKFTGKITVTVKVEAKGIYKAASKTVTITVNPSGTTLLKMKNSASKSATVTWKRNTLVSGYDIQYSTNPKFTSGSKLIRLTKNSTVSRKLKNLKKGKTYYVRIRTYKTVSGKKYYSVWSKAKRIKISR